MKRLSKLIGFVVIFVTVMMAFCSISFAASVGEKLTIPESGWQRYEDTDRKILYTGDSWLTDSYADYSGGTIHYRLSGTVSDILKDKVNFKFYGSKLRIISQIYDGSTQGTTTSAQIAVYIDGIQSGIYDTSKTKEYSILLYEKVNLSLDIHSVEIRCLDGIRWSFDAIDIDSTGYLIGKNQPTNLAATAGNKTVTLKWDEVEGATSYTVKRGTTAGGEYETVKTDITTNTYTDTGLTNGTTYYYVVSAMVSGIESANSNEVSATPKSTSVSLEVTSVDKAKVGDEITANVVIHNATNICAEDIKLAFDTTKLEFISAESADGIKIYKDIDLTNGIRRYITASLGKANAANGDKILLKLKFKAKAIGDAKIDITNGRIADNATLEVDITDENCGEKTIIIEGAKDVNRSGEYTLLDLGIDAWLYGDAVTDTIKESYDADQDANDTVDDADLTEIVKQMLNNKNYPIATQG